MIFANQMNQGVIKEKKILFFNHWTSNKLRNKLDIGAN